MGFILVNIPSSFVWSPTPTWSSFSHDFYFLRVPAKSPPWELLSPLSWGPGVVNSAQGLTDSAGFLPSFLGLLQFSCLPPFHDSRSFALCPCQALPSFQGCFLPRQMSYFGAVGRWPAHVLLSAWVLPFFFPTTPRSCCLCWGGTFVLCLIFNS